MYLLLLQNQPNCGIFKFGFLILQLAYKFKVGHWSFTSKNQLKYWLWDFGEISHEKHMSDQKWVVLYHYGNDVM